jgi:cytochrome d ubiquinol oxidase subunit II
VGAGDRREHGSAQQIGQATGRQGGGQGGRTEVARAAGVLAVVVAAYPAAVVAVVGLFVLNADAPHVFEGLRSRALPTVILSVLCGFGALVLLMRSAAAAAPEATLVTLLVAVGLAVLIVVPGFVLLYVLDQRTLLPAEGTEDVGDRPIISGG